MIQLRTAALLDCIFAVWFSLASGSETCSQPPMYDAWKFIDNLKEGYIKYKNYNDSRLCVHLRQLDANAEQIAIYNSSFRTYADPNVNSELLLARVKKCSNVLNMYNISGTAVYNAELVYSNELYCGIFKSQLPTSEPHCALWVNSIAQSDDIDACVNKFNNSCITEKHDVYPDDTCGQVP